MSFQRANSQASDQYTLNNNKLNTIKPSNTQMHGINENQIKKSQKQSQSSKKKQHIAHDKLKLMQQVFTSITNSQSMPADRLTDALLALGHDPRNDITYQDFLIEHNLIETNGTFIGLLDFEHYAILVIDYEEKLHLEEEALRRLDLKIAFESFDLNKDGMLDSNELSEFMNILGFPIDDREAKSMIEFADLDKDSLLSFDEFLIVLTQISTINASKVQI